MFFFCTGPHKLCSQSFSAFLPIPCHSQAAGLHAIPHQLPCGLGCSFDLRHRLVPGSAQDSGMMVSSTRHDYPNHFLL